MKLCGIVSEYNPFHKGHKYHIEETKRLTGCDGIVAVMSGNFVQRGEGALFSKDARAKAAVLSGVDVVLELSPFYALSSAERFSESAIKILSSIPEVKYLSFGTENDDLESLKKTADILSNEPDEFKEELKKELEKGISYPLARENALKKIGEEKLSKTLLSPNNILGIEYLKALNKYKSSIVPISVKRKGEKHDSLSFGEITSASFLRDKYRNNEIKEFLSGVPDDLQGLYQEEKFFDKESFEKMILSRIILMDKNELKEISGIKEGLENRIKEKIKDAKNLSELCKMVKSKRYTYSGIRRSLLSAGLFIKEEKDLPMFSKILAYSENGQKILNKIKKTSKLPIVKNMTVIKKTGDKNLISKYEKETEIDLIYKLYLKGGKNGKR